MSVLDWLMARHLAWWSGRPLVGSVIMALVPTAALATVVLAAGCGGGGDGADHHYPAADRTGFMNACTAQGAAAEACDCTFQLVERQVDEQLFEATDAAAQREVRRQVIDAANACGGA